jgi:hypothetical protein
MTEVKKLATPPLLAHAGGTSFQPRLREEHENRDRTVGEAIKEQVFASWVCTVMVCKVSTRSPNITIAVSRYHFS